MVTTERDAFVSVSHVLAEWDLRLTDAEHELETMRAATGATVERLSHQLEEDKAGYEQAATEVDAERAEVLEAIRGLHAEVTQAREHVDHVFDGLAHEVTATTTHLGELREQLHAPAARVDHAADQLHATMAHVEHESRGGFEALTQHLAHQVPTSTQALDEDVAGAFGEVAQRVVMEWLPTMQSAVHEVAGALDRAGSHAEAHARDAHEESARHADETVRSTEVHRAELQGRSHQQARATAGTLQTSAETAHAVGATLIGGADALNEASNVCNTGLNTALGILRELEHLFSHFG